VVVAAPERAANIIATFSPDIITEPLPGNTLNKSHVAHILKLAQNFDAVVIGNGLGREKKTLLAVCRFITKVTLPCVIDADGIHAVAQKPNILRKNHIITPHGYEFFILTGKKPSKNLKERTSQVKKTAKNLGSTIILKGKADVISNGTNTAINNTGNPYMTKGGTGDILAGVCGAFLSMGIKPFESACASAYITGRAGEVCFKNFGPSLLASDIVFTIPDVMKSLRIQ